MEHFCFIVLHLPLCHKISFQFQYALQTDIQVCADPQKHKYHLQNQLPEHQICNETYRELKDVQPQKANTHGNWILSNQLSP